MRNGNPTERDSAIFQLVSLLALPKCPQLEDDSRNFQENAEKLPERRPDEPIHKRYSIWKPCITKSIGRQIVPASLSYIFFGFIIPIFIALLICIEQPAISFCDIEDFADVISCMAVVLFSPSGIFITISSAFAMLASEQPIDFDLADTGVTANARVTHKAVRIIFEIMLFLEI
jgi:hypothetical protein